MTELEADTPVTQVLCLFTAWRSLSLTSFLCTFLPSLSKSQFLWQCDYDRLSLSTNPFMEKNVEFLIGCMDDLSMEQQKVNLIYMPLFSCFVFIFDLVT